MESEDYETNRNLTLMFFLEKLLDNKSGGQRSLHDLSCQFGTKGFSREMRQIAGGSQAGLRRFFKQYPSLFTVEGDMVSITTHSSSQSSNESRDYIAEAVKYFEIRLEQYGPGTEVPIKSLLGHRSQAPPEVRHVSGQHVKEFRDFLGKHSETFVIREDDIIFLKKYEGFTTSVSSGDNGPGGPGHFEVTPTPKLDPQLTNQLLSTIREHLENCEEEEEVALADLFERVMPVLESSKCLPIIIKRQQDLMTFLKMHSHLFRVNAGMVSLIPIPRQNLASPTKRSNKSSSQPNFAGITCIPQQNQQQQSLKQRVNSVVLKVLADNSDRDKTSPTPQQTSSTGQDDGAHRMNVFQRTRVVLSHRESSKILEEMMRRGEAVAIDCEGVNLSTPSKGQVTLVQMGVMSGQAYILDVSTDPKIWEEGQLKSVLECNHVVKVLHDCRNISSVLKAQFGIDLCNVFDAQVSLDPTSLFSHYDSYL